MADMVDISVEWVSLILLVSTFVVAVLTYLRARKNGLREAVRDVGEVGIHRRLKAKPVFRSCQFFPQGQTLVEVQFFRRASGGHHGPRTDFGPWTPTEVALVERGVLEEVEDVRGVVEVSTVGVDESHSLRVVCSTADANRLMEIVDEILSIVKTRLGD